MPLPMPGSPAASWAVYRARLKAVFDGADPRVCAAFWLFGKCSAWLPADGSEHLDVHTWYHEHVTPHALRASGLSADTVFNGSFSS